MLGKDEVWSAVRRTPAAITLYAAIVTVLVGATSAFMVFEKKVSLTVDGRAQEVQSFAGTVGEVLSREGVEVDKRDVVTPDLDTPVQGDTRIVVRHDRPLRLTVDGRTRKVRVTALTVAKALQQLGIRAPNADLSAPRSQQIPLDGFHLAVHRQHRVVVAVNDARHEMRTTATSVRQVIAEAGVTLGPHDQVSVDPKAYPRNGMVIRIIQLLSAPKTEKKEIPFETVEKKDDEMTKGEKEVAEEGKPGIKKVVWAYVKENGTKVRKVIREEVVREPQKEIVKIGTKEPEHGTVPGLDDLNWAALADCESSGNPNAVNPAGPYYGLYQFDAQTWHSVGGTGVPTDHSAEEQTYRAKLLYKQRGGAAAWPRCGSQLFS